MSMFISTLGKEVFFAHQLLTLHGIELQYISNGE